MLKYDLAVSLKHVQNIGFVIDIESHSLSPECVKLNTRTIEKSRLYYVILEIAVIWDDPLTIILPLAMLTWAMLTNLSGQVWWGSCMNARVHGHSARGVTIGNHHPHWPLSKLVETAQCPQISDIKTGNKLTEIDLNGIISVLYLFNHCSFL